MVVGGNSCSRGRGFESQHRILDGHFSHYIDAKNSNICLKKTDNYQKEAGNGPF